jgi:VCBS repeat-containing protein
LTINAASGVLDNDSDADGNDLTATVTVQPTHGTLQFNDDGSFTYTPNDDYHGTDTFKYKANDGFSDSAEATVTITIASINDAPVAENDSYDVVIDSTLTVTTDQGVLDNDTDDDGDPLTADVVTQPQHGTLDFDDDGSFTYTPTSGYHGEDTFTYKANDGTTDSATATVTINVNAPPAAVADSYTVDEDGNLTKNAADGVLANDTDADGDSLTMTVVDQPDHGTLDINDDGSFTYTPNADYHGTDTFTYKANDGTHDSAEATVTITINPVEDDPVAAADSFQVPVNGQLIVNAANGVLANDTDADDDTITAAAVTDPAHGTLTLNADGSFEYEPEADYHGTDTFTYKANDGSNDSSVVTVTIDVNSLPEAVDDDYSTTMDTQLVVAAAEGLLVNDNDADGDSLTFTIVTQPAHGTLTTETDGSFTYTPATGYHGADSFTYTLNDGYGDSVEATVTLTVNAIPAVADDSYSVNEDEELAIDAAGGVLNNDSDADDDTLTVTVVAEPSHGTLTLESDGSFTYTPDEDYSGADSFSYKANDGTDDSATATVSITVTAVADDPEAVDDIYSVLPNNTLTVSAAQGLLANDTDADGDSLTATIVDQPTNGTLTPNSDGSFSYEPNQDFHGTDTFTYKANDGSTDSELATVTINVNTAPSAESDAYSVAEDGELNVAAATGVLDNDTDADGDSLTAAIVVEPSHGTLTFEDDGSFTYVPDADYAGDDGFTYVANDGYTDSSEATVVITVTPVNDAPVAADDVYSVPVNGSLTVDATAGVKANDWDVDGDAITVDVADGPDNGQLTLNDDGSFTYTPSADFHGTDTFTYTVNDGTVDSAEATVSIDVNTLSTAADDTYTVSEDGTLVKDAAAGILGNDSDVDDDQMTAVLLTAPANGTLTLDTDGSFEYTPNADFHGTDTFTYDVDDGFGHSAAATVTITVEPVNDAPEAVADSYPVLPNGTLSLSAAAGVLANDTDADDDTLNVTLVTGPAHGTLLIGADGAFTYTPDDDYEGEDSFTYLVNDGTVDSLAATVTLDVDSDAALADQAFAEEQDWL